MRESRSSGSVRGAASDGRPYRELISSAGVKVNSRATLPLGHQARLREVGASKRSLWSNVGPIAFK